MELSYEGAPIERRLSVGIDAVGMRAALVELGRRRLARDITEAEFRRQRALIFLPFLETPPSQTLPAGGAGRAARLREMMFR